MINANENENALIDALEIFLEMIPNRDAELNVDPITPEFFNFSVEDNWSIQLVLMRLAMKNYELNRAFRQTLSKMLTQPTITLNEAVKSFIADLILTAPIAKSNLKKTLVRDVLIIWSLMILRRLGYDPTKNEISEGDKPSGSQVVFEYLVLRRGLSFADTAETIHAIWSDRHKRIKQINLEEVLTFDEV